jgi:hypothetical protein
MGDKVPQLSTTANLKTRVLFSLDRAASASQVAGAPGVVRGKGVIRERV